MSVQARDPLCGRRGIAIISLLLALPTVGSAQASEHAADRRGDSSTYAREAVRVRSGKVLLAGTLFLPASAGPHPMALLVPGSRGSRFLPGVAEHLAEQGIAVLDLNKRGVGGSTGRWNRQSFRDRADDVVAAIEFLRTRIEVDSARIGIVAHSQGGWIAQMVAAERSDLAFAVLLATPGQSVRGQILTDERISRERRGMPAPQVEREMKSLHRKLGVLQATAPLCRTLRAHYLCHIIDFDPAPFIARILVPVLALYGDLDPMAPPHIEAELLRAGLASAGNRDVTMHVFPKANHLFWEARTGLQDEYHSLEDRYVAGFLDMVSDWIADRVHAREAPARRVTATTLYQQ